MALSDVTAADVPSVRLAVLRLSARPAELSAVVPHACGVVWSFLRAHDLRGGRHVAIYWDGAIRLEVGTEFEGELPIDGKVVASATPAGRVASVAHFGPYHQLGAAHAAIRDWCSRHGEKPAGPNWEVYGHWRDEWSADPSLIRTDVFYQLT